MAVARPRTRLPLVPAILAIAPALAPAAEPVRFDWFEYTGHDVSRAVPAGHFGNPILRGYYPDPAIERVGDAVAGGFVGTVLGPYARQD